MKTTAFTHTLFYKKGCIGFTHSLKRLTTILLLNNSPPTSLLQLFLASSAFTLTAIFYLIIISI